MREIKFRSWAVASKAMFYPDSNDDWTIDKGIIHPLPNTVLMQYTGLKDKNGKEIYEGDIVEYWLSPASRKPSFVRTVEWRQNQQNYGFNIGKSPTSSSWFEVIGNIWENPELLTGGKIDD